MILKGAVAISSDLEESLYADPPSPSQNDRLWGAFFASGNTAYITRLLDQVKHINNRDNSVLFVTAASAKWSLSSNSQFHPLVKTTVQAARDSAAEPFIGEYNDILSKFPAQIKEECMEVMRDQGRNRAWHDNYK